MYVDQCIPDFQKSEKDAKSHKNEASETLFAYAAKK